MSEVQKASGDSKGSIVVVNMRGLVNTRAPVLKTLGQLKLMRRFNATIVPDNNMFRGMLQSIKDHAAWCELDSSTAELLLSQRLEISEGKKVHESQLKTLSGYSSFAELARALTSGEARLDSSQMFGRVFRLSPPRGGFKSSTRRQFGEGGILGPNRNLPAIIKNMV